MTTERTPQDEAESALKIAETSGLYPERTPQDVLRATPREKAIAALAELARWYPESSLANGLVNDIQAALIDDKAIAEAPDSPPPAVTAEAAMRSAFEREVRTPHAILHRLREMGYDVVPTGRFDVRAWAGGVEDGVRSLREAPDTLSEKPGLDVALLTRAEHNRFMNVGDERCDHGRYSNDCERVARFVAMEYARLGSTDSEGG